jgi:tetratricopeptide (TPR) repeat protein
VIQMTPSRVHVHRVSDGFLTHTNYFHSEELRKTEALLSGAYCEDLEARFCRIRQLLEPHRGRLEPQHMARALGDHVDYFTGQERVFGNTLSVMTTIKSAVFEPEALRFWIGTRKKSPVGLGEFLAVDVEKFWKQSAEECEVKAQMISGYQPKSPGLLEAVTHYREAYRTYHLEAHTEGYPERTLDHLRKAAQAFPEDGHLWIQAGIVAIKIRRFEEARGFFERTLALKLSRHVVLVRDLYLARCLDVLGERKQAKEIYLRNSQLAIEPKLKKAFKRGLRRAYRLTHPSQMVVDLQFPDTFAY